MKISPLAQKRAAIRKAQAMRIEKLAIRATTWIGSTSSLVVHTILFITSFLLIFFGFEADKVLLVLTTIVSLEAIYLSIFIQMSVNRSNRRLVAVRKDLEEIHEEVEEISEDVEGIQADVEHIEEDIGEIQKDVEEIQGDVDEISDDIEGIQEEVKELGEDVEDIGEEMDEDEEAGKARDAMIMTKMEVTLGQLMEEIKILKEQTAKKVKVKKEE